MSYLAHYIIDRLGYAGSISGTILTLYVPPAVAEDLTKVFNNSEFGRSVASLSETPNTRFTQWLNINTSELISDMNGAYTLVEKAKDSLASLTEILAQRKDDSRDLC